MAATALSPQAQQIGRLILQKALAGGVPAQRAPELVDAAYSESSLNPAAVNKTSGATGLFQLLSPGYVHTAQQLGGVTDPTANLEAILPEYRSFWQQNPAAPAGAAAAAVERSGEGAGFYSNGVGRQIQGVPVAAAAAPTRAPLRPRQPEPAATAAADPLASLSDELLGRTARPATATPAAANPLDALASDLLGVRAATPRPAAPSAPASRQTQPAATAPSVTPQAAAPPATGGPAKLAAVPNLFDTRPGIQVNQQILPAVEQLAKQFSVRVNSGYRSPSHNAAVGGAPNSDHLTGNAVDFTGTPEALRALYKYALGKYPYVEPWSQTGGSHDHISFLRGSGR